MKKWPLVLAALALVAVVGALTLVNLVIADRVGTPQCRARCVGLGAASGRFDMHDKRPGCACLEADGSARGVAERFYPNVFASADDGAGSLGAWVALQSMCATAVLVPFLLALRVLKRRVG